MDEIKEYSPYGGHLKVLIRGDVYAMDIYKSFKDMIDLENYVESEFGTRQFEYFYG